MLFSVAFLVFPEVQLNFQPLFPGESGVDQLVEIIKVRVCHPRFSINLDLFIRELCNSDILNECVNYFWSFDLSLYSQGNGYLLL